MLAGGDRVLVAVSGGADSTALLHCLHGLATELHLTLTVAHLNHRHPRRGRGCRRRLCPQMSAGLGLPFISEIIDVKQQASAEKQNLEEFARQMRYDFLSRTAPDWGRRRLLLGTP